MSAIDDLLAQYDKNSKPSSQISQEDRLKKYFAPILDEKKETTKQIKIRLLPAKPGQKLAAEVYFHDILVDGKKVKLYDPRQDGKPSPLNDVYDGLMLTGKEEDKKLASEYKARKFYILKVIDRDHEEDGVKFWRFKHAAKGDGIMDKIIPIIRSKGDITDVKNGRDLTLTLVLSTAPNGKKYTSISSIIPEDKEPLTTNEDWFKEWTEDTSTWENVYGKKPIEYLEMVASGEVPMWDKVTSKWVSKNEMSSAGQTTFEPSKKQASIPDPQADSDSDNDLPF